MPPVLFSHDLDAIGRPVVIAGADTLQVVPLSADVAEGPTRPRRRRHGHGERVARDLVTLPAEVAGAYWLCLEREKSERWLHRHISAHIRGSQNVPIWTYLIGT